MCIRDRVEGARARRKTQKSLLGIIDEKMWRGIAILALLLRVALSEESLLERRIIGALSKHGMGERHRRIIGGQPAAGKYVQSRAFHVSLLHCSD